MATTSTSTGDGVLVVGMHRSGTSAATSALAALGLRTCREDDLFATRAGNERGYWESATLTRFNDALLEELGGAWHRPPPAGAIADAVRDDARLADARATFEDLHPDAPWVWKDPRNCLLLPLWRAAIGAPRASILMLRDPVEVASSLRARDGIDEERALAVWERYLRSALAALAGQPVFVSEYRALVANPLAWARSVAAFLRSRGVDTASPEDAAARIDPSLRHETSGGTELGSRVSDEQRDLLARALGLSGAHDALPALELPDETPATTELLAAPPALGGGGRTAGDEPRAALGAEWARWLAKNRLRGPSDDDLIDVMARSGIEKGDAQAEVERLDSDPGFAAARWAAGKLRKLESLLEIQEQLRDLDPGAREVERRAGLPPEEFLSGYYAAQRPVILTDYATGWPACRWTPESLAQVLGDEPVEVMSGRDSDERYELNSERHRSTVAFREFAERVQSEGRSNDAYLVANNHLLDRPSAEPLWRDFDPRPPLDAAAARGRTYLWFGPAGTVTPLHHDVMNVLFTQLHGRKRFLLIAPGFTPRLHNEVGVFSEVDPLESDAARQPDFAGVPVTTVVLEPGETLFLPVGWWHHVESLDVSISLSFTGFAHPNTFRWRHPA